MNPRSIYASCEYTYADKTGSSRLITEQTQEDSLNMTSKKENSSIEEFDDIESEMT